MPSRLSSLLDLQVISHPQLEVLFSFAESLKKKARAPRHKGEFATLAFFEASTRTRLSFEAACIRAGVLPILFDGGLKTSLEKGESIEDSLLNMAAMHPSLLIVRCSDSVDLPHLAQKFPVPVVSGGWGMKSHPTQALLDLLTLKSKWQVLEGKKLLLIGDVKHSRVVQSHIELAEKFGLELGQCGPAGFQSNHPIFTSFGSLEEGLKWADAAMALRFQFERHDQSVALSREEYRQNYGLNSRSLKVFKTEGWILHPGPVNHGIEMETEVFQDPRCCVLEQVHNGVFVREAIVRTILGETP